MYLNKHLKLQVTIIVSDNFFVNKICNKSFLIFEILKFYTCAEPRVEISMQDGCMGYLSLILYLREGTTVIILNIGTDRSEQTVQTQIRLLLMEQSDQGLLCLLFCLHLLNTILHCKIQLF